ncbi:DinB family protein [Draconibacterium sp.]|nr:DinB family protein [Draconibacterium sp.]
MKKTAKENLMQIKHLLDCIKKEDYKQKTEILSGATIGQHVRHILEFYLLLVSGSFLGTISYDKRERDVRIESDPKFAAGTINRLIKGMDTLDENFLLKFEGDFTADGSSQNIIQSSVGRELAYCIEHSIHHQAIIKAGLISLGLGSLTDVQFGVAYSTIRYRENKCAL